MNGAKFFDLHAKWRQIFETFFSFPDYTVGTGITPVRRLAPFADFYCRWGISPRPKESFLFCNIIASLFCPVNCFTLPPIKFPNPNWFVWVLPSKRSLLPNAPLKRFSPCSDDFYNAYNIPSLLRLCAFFSISDRPLNVKHVLCQCFFVKFVLQFKHGKFICYAIKRIYKWNRSEQAEICRKGRSFCHECVRLDNRENPAECGKYLPYLQSVQNQRRLPVGSFRLTIDLRSFRSAVGSTIFSDLQSALQDFWLAVVSIVFRIDCLSDKKSPSKDDLFFSNRKK